MKFSVIIPAYNEAENLPGLMRELHDAMGRLHGDFEVIVIDDGSVDDTYPVLRDLKGRFPAIRIIKFKKNCGQSAALQAGIRHSVGDLIVTMDADGQNDPRDIEKLLEHLPENDVIAGVRTDRRDSLVKLASSRIANAVRNWLTNEDIVDTGCSLKMFRADVLKRVPMYDGMHRFLPTLCRMHGARVRQVPVSHRPRTRGKSKYGISNRAFRALVDALAVRWMTRRGIHCEIERIDE